MTFLEDFAGNAPSFNPFLCRSFQTYVYDAWILFVLEFSDFMDLAQSQPADRLTV